MPLQLISSVSKEGSIRLSLHDVAPLVPKDGEVVVQVGAAPINPSDLGLLLGPSDVRTAKTEAGVTDIAIPPKLLKMVKVRVDNPLPVGNEGAGIVVKAGASPEAQALLGRTVGVVGGGMYAEYRKVKAKTCLLFPEGTKPIDAASWFVNPMTALAMPETMKLEGFKGLVHTAAASNLGQMLVKICNDDGIPLVNIVRKQEQVELLQAIGAKYIVNSSSPTFQKDLTKAIAETGAYIAFDATGGGKLASDILSCMETAANMSAKGGFSIYGADVHKQVYIYGGLDRTPTTLNRNFGMSWGVGGWLLTPFLQKAGRDVQNRMRARVASEIHTTFKSSYTKQVSLKEALEVENIHQYSQQKTGEKYIIVPNGPVGASRL